MYLKSMFHYVGLSTKGQIGNVNNQINDDVHWLWYNIILYQWKDHFHTYIIAVIIYIPTKDKGHVGGMPVMFAWQTAVVVY